jgi:hypothetical protein
MPRTHAGFSRAAGRRPARCMIGHRARQAHAKRLRREPDRPAARRMPERAPVLEPARRPADDRALAARLQHPAVGEIRQSRHDLSRSIHRGQGRGFRRRRALALASLVPAPRPRERLDSVPSSCGFGVAAACSRATMRLRPPRRWNRMGMRTTSVVSFKCSRSTAPRSFVVCSPRRVVRRSGLRIARPWGCFRAGWRRRQPSLRRQAVM